MAWLPQRFAMVDDAVMHDMLQHQHCGITIIMMVARLLAPNAAHSVSLT
jgi:hypothetical protein